MPRDFVHPDETQRLHYGGCWTLPMTAPRVYGVARRSDSCFGLRVGDVLVDRAPGEQLDALIERAALNCGTDQAFELQYAP